MPTSSLLGAFLRAIGLGLFVGGIAVVEAVINGENVSSEVPVWTLIAVAYALILTGRYRETSTHRLRGDIDA